MALDPSFLSAPVVEWLPFLTLVVLLASQPWRQLQWGGTLAAWLGLLSTSLVVSGLVLWAREPWLWFALTVAHFWWIAKAYYVADNHYYLMGYWCLSVGLALTLDPGEGADALAQSATLLIGLCFLFATVSKLLNRQYRNGSFFVFTLLSDRRFLPIAWGIGGVDRVSRSAHASALQRVTSGESTTEQVPVPRKLRVTSRWLTWWTVLIEGTVALVFLLPVPALADVRAPLLAIFAVTTYVFVPVSPFGQILLVMALALPQPTIQRSVLLGLTVALPLLAQLSVSARFLISTRAFGLSVRGRSAALSSQKASVGMISGR